VDTSRAAANVGAGSESAPRGAHLLGKAEDVGGTTAQVNVERRGQGREAAGKGRGTRRVEPIARWVSVRRGPEPGCEVMIGRVDGALFILRELSMVRDWALPVRVEPLESSANHESGAQEGGRRRHVLRY
jgi:hypothetical protein